jgi:CBS domain-containing protein
MRVRNAAIAEVRNTFLSSRGALPSSAPDLETAMRASGVLDLSQLAHLAKGEHPINFQPRARPVASASKSGKRSSASATTRSGSPHEGGQVMRRTASTNVRDIASRQVVTVARDTTLAQCAQRMREEHVGSVVVVSGERPDTRPIGIVTDRDIVVEAVAASLDPNTITAGDVMAASLGTVDEGDDVLDVLARMRENGVRRIPVTDNTGRLAGIVALDDLLWVLVQQFISVADVISSERAKESSTRPAR